MKAKDRQEKVDFIIKHLGERPKNIQSWTDLQIISMCNKIIYIQEQNKISREEKKPWQAEKTYINFKRGWGLWRLFIQ